jgi:CBS domain-containing protein
MNERIHRRAQDVPVREIMTTRVTAVRDDLSISGLVDLLVASDFCGLPVVDGENRPVGMASRTDVFQWVVQAVTDAGELKSLKTVAEIMMPIAFTVFEDQSIAEAAKLMATEGVHRLPVVSRAGKLVGIVSPLDILRWMA